MFPMSRDTPCNAVCFIDPQTDLCFGCGRTLPEIARWAAMTPIERHEIMATLPQRMQDAGLPLPVARPSKTDSAD
jgi:predicted Fe-S protein YdhL (DUF1289 family)